MLFGQTGTFYWAEFDLVGFFFLTDKQIILFEGWTFNFRHYLQLWKACI